MAQNNGDIHPFPVQGELRSHGGGKASTTPWWLAEEVYAEYSKRYGTSQSLERLGERGGFGRGEVLTFLRREDF